MPFGDALLSPIAITLLIALNLGVIYLLIAAPMGVRTVRMQRTIRASRQKLWDAVWLLGGNVGWSGQVLDATRVADDMVRLCLSWRGRDDKPIERTYRVFDVVPLERYSATVIEDNSLDLSFWADHRETIYLTGEEGAIEAVFSRTDRCRGLAMFVFRYFAMRREIARLKSWAETGKFRRGGIFEHPLTQVGFALLSTFILWPLFGLTRTGLFYSAVLTSVVALHELGHMAAFRLMGHRRARMIFIPLLGGVAIGGRPYDSRFEVAFVALMGAGFSAFVTAIALGASVHAASAGEAYLANLLMIFAGCSALFNLANLAPMWKFDGGQVLRQICPGAPVLAAASFALLILLLAFGYLAGFSTRVLIVAGIVVALLSLITSGSGVKPRYELKPILTRDRWAMAAALLAVFTVHGAGVVWAARQLMG
jgi:Zn-dependent protease